MSYELTEPHFDDERTLLSARRVIPLDTVSRRKQWWLSATIAVAAALGTLGGFIYYRRGTPAPTQHLSQATQAGVGAMFEEPVDSALTNTTEELAVEEEAVEASDELSDMAVKPSVDSATETTPRRPPRVTQPVQEANPAAEEATPEDESEDVPASRKVDRWEERRERRMRRRNQDEQPNDLFRIDQIFEGAPRP